MQQLVALYIFQKITHNTYMIYLGSLIAGTINGLFASGAGQILVFFLIYIMKLDTHKARATSLFCTSIATAVSIVSYFKIVQVGIANVVIAAISGICLGAVGSKLMNKIKSNILNLVSGIIILTFSLYSIFVK